jgi:hypothetical protein
MAWRCRLQTYSLAAKRNAAGNRIEQAHAEASLPAVNPVEQRRRLFDEAGDTAGHLGCIQPQCQPPSGQHTARDAADPRASSRSVDRWAGWTPRSRPLIYTLGYATNWWLPEFCRATHSLPPPQGWRLAMAGRRVEQPRASRNIVLFRPFHVAGSIYPRALLSTQISTFSEVVLRPVPLK